jgi:hypothetical protein
MPQNKNAHINLGYWAVCWKGVHHIIAFTLFIFTIEVTIRRQKCNPTVRQKNNKQKKKQQHRVLSIGADLVD